MPKIFCNSVSFFLYYAHLYNRKKCIQYIQFSFWMYGCLYWTCFDWLSFVFPRLTWSTSFTRANWRTMCGVWSVAMRAGGLTRTWTSLWSSGPSGPARLLAAWCVRPSLWPFICSCGAFVFVLYANKTSCQYLHMLIGDFNIVWYGNMTIAIS